MNRKLLLQIICLACVISSFAQGKLLHSSQYVVNSCWAVTFGQINYYPVTPKVYDDKIYEDCLYMGNAKFPFIGKNSRDNTRIYKVSENVNYVVGENYSLEELAALNILGTTTYMHTCYQQSAVVPQNSGTSVGGNYYDRSSGNSNNSNEPTSVSCHNCNGTGRCGMAYYKGYCHGSGLCQYCSGGIIYSYGVKTVCRNCMPNAPGKCHYCNGTGKCQTCNGTGRIMR